MFRARRKYILIIIGLLAAVVLAHPLFAMFWSGGTDSLTISELKEKGEAMYGQQIEIKGRVEPTSVSWDATTRVLGFVLSDDRERVGVFYNGVAPDSFKPGAKLAVEGEYTTAGVIEARTLGEKRSPFCNICH